jgi:uncharacterized protein YecT (DUF1311 family)
MVRMTVVVVVVGAMWCSLALAQAVSSWFLVGESALEDARWECNHLARSANLTDRAYSDFVANCLAPMAQRVDEQLKSYKKAEEQLNQTYREVRLIVKERNGQESPLVIAQREWAKYREWHCSFDVANQVGNYAARYRAAQCLEKEARRRIDYLESLR